MNALQSTSENNIATEVSSALLDHLICPACKDPHAELIKLQDRITCKQCENHFPLLRCLDSEIPWLYQMPEQHMLEWQARLNGFLHINQVEQQRLKEGLKDKRLSKIGQKRLRKLLDAKKQHCEQVLALLKPLNLKEQGNLTNNVISSQQTKTPKVQGLTSYYDNILRDWAWENDEHVQMLAAIEKVLDQKHKNALGKVLSIGSGAGRLSYDIHRTYSVAYSLLLDINPLLMFSACNVIQGNSFELNEFPIAPMNKQSFYKTQTCNAPHAIKENFYYLFADGMNPPIKANSFDTVLTPWLIDIIPQNLRDYIPRINRCIRKGGIWLNTGSLAFFHKQASWCYSEEEVIELVEKNGFELIATDRSTIHYMHSPLSAHGRTENVFSFCAKKVRDVTPPDQYEYLPNWIRNTAKPIPKQFDYEIRSSKHLLQAQVLGAVDGKRSIEQIGELVAKQYNLELAESFHAVRQIMIDIYEDQ